MADVTSTAPTATGNGADACVPSGAGSPVSQSAGAASQIPEWMHPMIQAARAATIDYDPESPAAFVSALSTYRSAVRLALRQLYSGEGEGVVRRTLAEGLLTAEGYLARMDEAIALISRYDAAMPREALRHYIVEPARLYAGARAYNGCACGRVWERFGGPDEHAARLHVRLMSLPNILSGECDCPGNRDAIPVFEDRCTGCGAVLHGAALANRRGAA